MKNIVLIPDSFKGTMSSAEVCAIMAAAFQRHMDVNVASVPVADGGEGSVDAFLQALGGEKVTLPVQGPFGEEVPGFYGLLPGDVAVVEMAAAAGLPLVGDRLEVMRTTTYGVGQLMADALGKGAKKLIVGLGGSATNDGACGLAAALGVRFYDEDGAAFVPVGGTLGRIARVDVSGLAPALQGVELVGMCDIDNPLCGENGAAAVFGPQKGAGEADVALLDAGLANLARVLQRDLGADVLTLPGGGAAGGMGAGLVGMLGARLQMGIQTVLDTVGFDGLLQTADLVLTGEGRLDSQSLRGKVVIGVARRAKAQGVPVVAVCGDVCEDLSGAYAEGVSAVFSINRVAKEFAAVKHRSKQDLASTMEDIVRLLQVAGW